MAETKSALVLGATGKIGGAVADLLIRRGWTVRALRRDRGQVTRAVSGAAGIDWIRGDAMNAGDVVGAATGTSLIVHGVNPPGYRGWGRVVLPMIDNTIAAARASGARILLPGTIYNYGPEAFPVLRETAPQRPRTRKGAIRAEMERRLQAASDFGVRSLVVRAGDYFGTGVANTWFAQGLLRGRKPVTALANPAAPGIGHAWAYVPDLAASMVALVERDAALDDFATYHFAGHWDPDGTMMFDAIRRVLGRPDLPVRPFPWWMVTAGASFVTTCREMLEMRYVWRVPIRLDNSKLVREIGAEPHTPLDDAIRASLRGLGHLDLPPTEAARLLAH